MGDAFLRNTRWLKWHILNIGDPLYQPFPDGLEPFNTALGENALAVFARNVVEGEVVNAAVVVDAPAPEGGRTVTLGVDASSPVSVPEFVVIPKDATFAVFPMSIGLVPSPATTQIIADNGIEILKNTVTVYPVLAALRVAAQALRGGESLRAMVVLNRLAPADGFTIALSTDRPDVVKVPATLLVAAGTNRAEFQIDTATVQEQATARITATFTAAEVSTAITLTP